MNATLSARERLISFREFLGLNQREFLKFLAEETGHVWSQSGYQKLESGEQVRPGTASAYALEKLMKQYARASHIKPVTMQEWMENP